MLQPSIGRRGSWLHFKENIASLIMEALLVLRSRIDLVKDEIPLNKLLRLCFREANFKLGLEYFPALDAENTQGSRPDLSWSIFNELAGRPEDCELCFALECKRLGKKTDAGWIFNEHYVIDGILRFFLEEKGYGKGCETGAMVGYVQDMEFNDILLEVNSYLTSHASSLSALAEPVNGWQSQGVSHFSHTFNLTVRYIISLRRSLIILSSTCLILRPIVEAMLLADKSGL